MISCDNCPAKAKCKTLCKKMQEYVNQDNAPRRERLVDTPEHIPQSAYNDTLHELMRDAEARDNERIERIRQIADPRKRLIAAGILAGCTHNEIANLTNISRSRITQIYQEIS